MSKETKVIPGRALADRCDSSLPSARLCSWLTVASTCQDSHGSTPGRYHCVQSAGLSWLLLLELNQPWVLPKVIQENINKYQTPPSNAHAAAHADRAGEIPVWWMSHPPRLHKVVQIKQQPLNQPPQGWYSSKCHVRSWNRAVHWEHESEPFPPPLLAQMIMRSELFISSSN